MEVMLILIIIGQVTEWLLKEPDDSEIRRRAETIHTTKLMRSVRILRRVLGTLGDCRHSNFIEEPSAKTDVKNSQGVK